MDKKNIPDFSLIRSPLPPALKGMLFSALGFTIFSCGDVLVKILSMTYSTSTVVFYNGLFLMLLALLFHKRLGGLRETLRTPFLKPHLARGLCLTLSFAAMVYGFGRMPMANTYALIFAAPFLTAILSIPLLREPVTRRQWTTIAVGFTGILIILRPGLIPLSLASVTVLAGAVFFALANIIARMMKSREQTLLSWILYFEFMILAIFTPLYAMNFELPSLPHAGMILITSLTSGAGVIFITRGFTLAPSASAAPFHYVQMVWAILFGYLVFGDILDIWMTVGSALIIGSGLWLIRREEETPAPSAKAHPESAP